jgi:hypothetical protein
MSKKTLLNESSGDNGQSGQSMVIIALVMVGLLAFTGLAVDVGLIFARSSQLQAAVDAAALAAVTEVTTVGDTVAADTKAVQFLNANGVPPAVTASMRSAAGVTPLKATEYSLTATWPVNLFFLKLVGQDIANVTKSATAAYFSLTDIYASRRVESGVLSTSNQAVFGPHICIDYGDPYSPLNSPWKPGLHAYEYRIFIPKDYAHDVIRVEIFDPDSINRPGTSGTVGHSDVAIALGDPVIESVNCNAGSNSDLRRNPCLLDTGELNWVGPQVLPGGTSIDVEIDHINPYWFLRIDENRGTGGAPGSGACGNPGNYNANYNTRTEYRLFYYRQNPNGVIQEVPLTQYTGQMGTEGVLHDTDLRWVSPGAARSFDQTTFVPIDTGWTKTFEISISNDLTNIVTDPSTGSRYLYLGVTALYGASENGFEIWAGPPDYVSTVPSEVNARNLHILRNPGSHNSEGVTVFGLGNLPMNSNYANAVEIPLVYIGPEYAGQKVFISLYDTDSGALPPITLFFDSIAESDWAMTFGAPGVDDPDGVTAGTRCLPGNCNKQWVNPPYQLTVPGILDNCDYSNPTMQDCTPFYGGRLTARYEGGTSDTYGWEIRLTGIPYLVR